MPPAATLKRTEALSVSTGFLPEGCQSFRHGLVLPENLSFEEWKAVGRRLTEVTGAAMWMLGDWLAYAERRYLDTVWGKRMPNDIYSQVASETGYSEGTLRNAKWVCSKLPLSRRGDKLTFSHAEEIVGRVREEGQYDYWIGRVQNEGLTRQRLREELKRTNATVRTEPNDSGSRSILEQTRQFVRDYQSAKPSITPKLRQEIAKILGPVLEDLR